MPIRIALVITELYVGGAERCLVELALGLDRERFDPLVVSLQAAPPPGPRRQLVDRLEAEGIPVHFLDATKMWHFRGTIRALARLCREQDVALVQSFLFHANIVSAKATQDLRIPWVAGIRVAEPRRWRIWYERKALRHAERVVCVSDSVARYARHTLQLPDRILIAIPNGIRGDRYAQAEPADLAEFGIAETDPVALFIGRLDRQKGLDWLLDVMPTVFQQHPSLRLVLVGTGPEQERLQRQARALAAALRIHFVGWRADVPQLLRRASLLVLPSRWEGMPNVVLEAMAAGKPVVASRADGVEQLLGGHLSEQTADFGDDDALVSRFLDLLRSPDLANRLGEENRQRAADRFSLAAMVAQYSDLYWTLARPR